MADADYVSTFQDALSMLSARTQMLLTTANTWSCRMQKRLLVCTFNTFNCHSLYRIHNIYQYNNLVDLHGIVLYHVP